MCHLPWLLTGEESILNTTNELCVVGIGWYAVASLHLSPLPLTAWLLDNLYQQTGVHCHS